MIPRFYLRDTDMVELWRDSARCGLVDLLGCHASAVFLSFDTGLRLPAPRPQISNLLLHYAKQSARHHTPLPVLYNVLTCRRPVGTSRRLAARMDYRRQRCLSPRDGWKLPDVGFQRLGGRWSSVILYRGGVLPIGERFAQRLWSL